MRKYIPFLLIPLLVLTTCETNPPQIHSLFWQYTFRKDLNLNRELCEVSLFLNIMDEDGQDDIETIFLFQDEKNLYWEITSDSWIKANEKDMNWLGINNLRMPDGSPLPRGKYRLVVRDIGGESAEEFIELESGQIRKIYPQVSISEGKLSVQGRIPACVLRLYDSTDKFIHRYVYTRGDDVDIQQDLIQRHRLTRGSYLDVYYFDENQNAGFVTGPYYLFSEAQTAN